MGTVLDTIAAYARERVAADKQALPLDELKERCRGMDGPGENPFLAALKRPGMSFICEIKKASPSKGVISREFPYLDIAREYERAGADAVSCLTEPKWFLGSDEIFRDVRREVTLPMLRKDFTVDEYQIWASVYERTLPTMLSFRPKHRFVPLTSQGESRVNFSLIETSLYSGLLNT